KSCHGLAADPRLLGLCRLEDPGLRSPRNADPSDWPASKIVNRDFLDLLEALRDRQVRFLVVGAHALAAHGFPRATGDLDVWVAIEPTNAQRVWQALVDFGAPVAALDISPADSETLGRVVQLG